MLFYNHKQKFIGMDEEGLKLLNYTSFEELLGVCSDVADLFAKEPGYIHNFKNFGWIDFLLHADSDATSAIVHGNGRVFTCTLNVQRLFLSEDPSESGYIIDMTHIKSLSGEEIKPHVISPRPIQESAPIVSEKIIPQSTPTPSALPDYAHLTPTVLSEPDTLDVPSFTDEEFDHTPEPSDDLYAKLALPLSEEELAMEEEYVPDEPKPSELPMLGDTHYSHAEQAYIDTLKTDKSYRFDPQIAANELGLPVDLIQEFIGDFIQQSYEFKEELFEAALKGDMNNLKILSHKLKGVAANLRIEDAFETLGIINTSNDPTEIEANLKFFYAIIAKLEGKEHEDPTEDSYTSVFKEDAVSETDNQLTDSYPSDPPEEEDDIYHFALKHDPDEPLLLQEEDLIALPIASEQEFLYNAEEELPDSLSAAQEETSVDEIPYMPEQEPLVSTEYELPDSLLTLPELAEEIPDIAETESLDSKEDADVQLHYDEVVIAGELGIELLFFKELLEDYKLNASRAAEQISNAISAFDTLSWKKIAGEFKGISDNLRLNEISHQLAILSQTNDAQEAHKASKQLSSFIAQL